MGANFSKSITGPAQLMITNFCSFPTGKTYMILTYSIDINPLRGIF